MCRSGRVGRSADGVGSRVPGGRTTVQMPWWNGGRGCRHGLSCTGVCEGTRPHRLPAGPPARTRSPAARPSPSSAGSSGLSSSSRPPLRIAQALGHLAVRQGAHVRFAKSNRILAELAGGHADRTGEADPRTGASRRAHPRRLRHAPALRRPGRGPLRTRLRAPEPVPDRHQPAGDHERARLPPEQAAQETHRQMRQIPGPLTPGPSTFHSCGSSSSQKTQTKYSSRTMFS